MPRPATGARERVLTVAVRQLRRAGSRNVTLDSLATEANCAKGLLTYHFGNRDRLLALAGRQLFAARESSWRNALSAATIDQAVRQAYRQVSTDVLDGFWRAWTSLWGEGTTLTVQAVNNHWDAFVSGISQSMTELLAPAGLEPSVEPAELGRLLAAGFQGLGLQLCTGADPAAVEAAHAALWVGALALTRPVS